MEEKTLVVRLSGWKIRPDRNKLREAVLEYYWMTCYPNADEEEFMNWLKQNDNEAFIDGLIDRIVCVLMNGSYR